MWRFCAKLVLLGVPLAHKKMKVALAPKVQKTILNNFDFYEVKMSQKFKINQYFLKKTVIQLKFSKSKPTLKRPKM